MAKRGITANTALRLARYFDMSPGLQMDYELDRAEASLAERLAREVRPYSQTE